MCVKGGQLLWATASLATSWRWNNSRTVMNSNGCMSSLLQTKFLLSLLIFWTVGITGRPLIWYLQSSAWQWKLQDTLGPLFIAENLVTWNQSQLNALFGGCPFGRMLDDVVFDSTVTGDSLLIASGTRFARLTRCRGTDIATAVTALSGLCLFVTALACVISS